MSVRIALALAIAFTASPVPSAEIYKCLDDQGRTVFSGALCGPTAETVSIRVTPPSTNTDAIGEQVRSVEHYNLQTTNDLKLRRTEREIARLEQQRKSLEKNHNTTLRRLETMPVSTVHQQMVAQQMIGNAQQQYASEIKKIDDELMSLRKIRDAALDSSR